MGNSKQKGRIEIRKGVPQFAGAQKIGEGYNFSAALGKYKEASLLLYKKGKKSLYAEIPLTDDYRFGDVISLWAAGLDDAEFEYQYKVDDTIFVDPSAKAVTGRKHFGDSEEFRKEQGMRGVLCGGTYQPSAVPGCYVPYHEMILYKLHVRGFTRGRTSNVTKKGTFAGLKEKIPYLKELGITSVELMPAYDFLEMPSMQRKVNYWGYTDGFYFAPKAAYCAGKDPIREFQDCVDSFHKEGLELLMEFYFKKDKNPFQIVEILRHWAHFYHVDGFHLVGEQIPMDLILQDDLLKRVKILYENYDVQQLPSKSCDRKYLAEYNAGFMRTIRCFLKSDRGLALEFIRYNRRNPGKIGVINYLTSQDGFTLADLVAYQERHNEWNGEDNRDGCSENFSWNCGVEGDTKRSVVLAMRKKQMYNGILFLMLSQGTPMLYAGDEFGNSQAGNNNAWCQDNAVGWLDWSKHKQNRELFEFVKAAIAFRKKHGVLHLDREIRDTDDLATGFPEISYHSDRTWMIDLDDQCRSVGIMYGGGYNHSEHLYIAYNMHWLEQKFSLPRLPGEAQWYKVEDNGFYQEPQVIDEGREVIIAPRTIVILTGK